MNEVSDLGLAPLSDVILGSGPETSSLQQMDPFAPNFSSEIIRMWM